ncbi:MAG: hypothetical protein WC102_11645, partial [Saccharofermentanales bacterium]
MKMSIRPDNEYMALRPAQQNEALNVLFSSSAHGIFTGHSSNFPLSQEKAKCNLKKLMIEIAELYYRMNSKTNVNIDRVISFIEDNT